MPRASESTSAAGESGSGAMPLPTGNTPTRTPCGARSWSAAPHPVGLGLPPCQKKEPAMAARWAAQARPACAVPLIIGAACPPWGAWLLLKMGCRGAQSTPGTRPCCQGQHPLPLCSAPSKLSLEIKLLTSSLQACFVVFYTSLQTFAPTAVSATTIISAGPVKTQEKVQPYFSEA